MTKDGNSLVGIKTRIRKERGICSSDEQRRRERSEEIKIGPMHFQELCSERMGVDHGG